MGRAAARKDQTEFMLHGKNGQIRAKDSYGNDPNPPKGLTTGRPKWRADGASNLSFTFCLTPATKKARISLDS